MSLQYGKAYRLERQIAQALDAGAAVLVRRGEAYYRLKKRPDGTTEEVLLEKLQGWSILDEPTFDEYRETSAPERAQSGPLTPGRGA